MTRKILARKDAKTPRKDKSKNIDIKRLVSYKEDDITPIHSIKQKVKFIIFYRAGAQGKETKIIINYELRIEEPLRGSFLMDFWGCWV